MSKVAVGSEILELMVLVFKGVTCGVVVSVSNFSDPLLGPFSVLKEKVKMIDTGNMGGKVK